MRRRLFMNRTNRDAAWKAGGKKGVRSSNRNQQLHPMHLEDYERETGVVLTDADKGFGNGIYRTFFSAVYSLTG